MTLREAVLHGLSYISDDLLHEELEGDASRIYDYEAPKD